MEAPRSATPYVNTSMDAVSWRPVRRRCKNNKHEHQTNKKKPFFPPSNLVSFPVVFDVPLVTRFQLLDRLHNLTQASRFSHFLTTFQNNQTTTNFETFRGKVGVTPGSVPIARNNLCMKKPIKPKNIISLFVSNLDQRRLPNETALPIGA
jgi:hypothetical protein